MKTERFEMRIDQTTAERLDEWRAAQAENLSRAEAVRRLIDIGLSATKTDEFYPDNSQRLMMAMLCQIMRQTGTDDELDPEFIEQAIYGGHFWALQWRMQGIFHGHVDTPATVRDVVNILDMWTFIESGVEKLSKAERDELLADEAISTTTFLGFDGNNETEYLGVARFLVEKMERFPRFKNHKMGLNSHMPTVSRYRAMAEMFDAIRPNLIGRELTKSELKSLLRHPARAGSIRSTALDELQERGQEFDAS